MFAHSLLIISKNSFLKNWVTGMVGIHPFNGAYLAVSIYNSKYLFNSK